MPMPGDVPLQMIASADVAMVSAVALLQPDRISSGVVEIAGDELTGDQIAAAYGERRGLDGRYEAVPPEVLDEDSRAMFEWFARPPAYQADFAATKQLHPQVMTFAEWLTPAQAGLPLGAETGGPLAGGALAHLGGYGRLGERPPFLDDSPGVNSVLREHTWAGGRND